MPDQSQPHLAVLSLGLPPEGRGMALFKSGRRPWAAVLDRQTVLELGEEARALLRVPAGVLVPGQDGELSRQEAALGARLAAVLEVAPLGPALATLAHGAAAAGERLTLLLDLRDDLLRALPWELLELLAPASSVLAPCRVARLAEAPGPSRPLRPALMLDVQVVRLDPQDPVCARVAQATLSCLERWPAVRAGEAESGASDPGNPASSLRVLHLVSHGRASVERVLVGLGGDRSLDPAATARWVDPVAAGLDLAVLDVCGGGSHEGEAGSAPAERLVQEGLPAAVAPSQPIDPAASIGFSTALYGALASGLPLDRAVEAGRRALARMGIPHPSCRWWTPVLVVRDAEALRLSCAAAPDGPSSWAPAAGPSVLELLRRAQELAAVHGFLGVEHLALMLGRWDPLPPRLALLREALEAVGQRLSSWQAGREREATPTPRLAELLAALPPGAGLAELGQALCAVEWVAACLPRLASEHASPETLQPGVDAGPHGALAPVRAVAACTLEVLGGPEDGRRLVWSREHALLGRFDPARGAVGAVELFLGSGSMDPAVSRRHLRLGPQGAVEVLADTHLERGGHAQRLIDGAGLAPGDVLVLGTATRLRVVDLQEGP